MSSLVLTRPIGPNVFFSATIRDVFFDSAEAIEHTSNGVAAESKFTSTAPALRFENTGEKIPSAEHIEFAPAPQRPHESGKSTGRIFTICAAMMGDGIFSPKDRFVMSAVNPLFLKPDADFSSADPAHIHACVSHRKYGDLVRELQYMALKCAEIDGADLPPALAGGFPEKEAVKTPLSVLSIGEGNSNFIETLIMNRALYLGVDVERLTFEDAPYCAMDIIFGVPKGDGSFAYPYDRPHDRLDVDLQRARMRQRVYGSISPMFYRFGFAHDFEIRHGRDGNLMQFDEVVVLHSVGLTTIEKEFERSTNRGYTLLVNMLRHVKPGGLLKINPLVIKKAAITEKVHNILTQLMEIGTIARYYMPMEAEWAFLAVQRGSGEEGLYQTE